LPAEPAHHYGLNQKSLWENDFDPAGFQGINCDDSDNSVVSFVRKGKSEDDFVIVAVNFTPVVRNGYKLGVPEKCEYEEIFNSDAGKYCGSNAGNFGSVTANNESAYGRPFSIDITLPPLGGVILKPKLAKKSSSNKASVKQTAPVKKSATKKSSTSKQTATKKPPVKKSDAVKKTATKKKTTTSKK